mmetsp:Transcript_148354/g.258798  ORF Transcript_148354/g.258798 Transcript_148354/m.258798 type:complete len:222 (-) Transcript_148354:358-1023(-)
MPRRPICEAAAADTGPRKSPCAEPAAALHQCRWGRRFRCSPDVPVDCRMDIGGGSRRGACCHAAGPTRGRSCTFQKRLAALSDAVSPSDREAHNAQAETGGRFGCPEGYRNPLMDTRNQGLPLGTNRAGGSSSTCKVVALQWLWPRPQPPGPMAVPVCGENSLPTHTARTPLLPMSACLPFAHCSDVCPLGCSLKNLRRAISQTRSRRGQTSRRRAGGQGP